MSSSPPPRHLPTLTEVVDPLVWNALASAATPVTPAAPVHSAATPVETNFSGRDALARQVIALVKPQLEAQLRSAALELFEAQYSALLPSLHLQIEEAVREAVKRAMPDPGQRED